MKFVLAMNEKICYRLDDIKFSFFMIIDLKNSLRTYTSKLPQLEIDIESGNIEELKAFLDNIKVFIDSYAPDNSISGELISCLRRIFDCSLNSSDNNLFKMSEYFYNFINETPLASIILDRERDLKYKILHSQISIKEEISESDIGPILLKIINNDKVINNDKENNRTSISLLHLAARSMNIDNIEYLVDNLNYDPNKLVTPKYCESPLFWMLDNLSCIDKFEGEHFEKFLESFKYLSKITSQKILLESVNPRQADGHSYNILQWLVYYQEKESITFLVNEIGIDLSDRRLNVNGLNLLKVIFDDAVINYQNNPNRELEGSLINFDFVKFLVDNGLAVDGNCFDEDSKTVVSATLSSFFPLLNLKSSINSANAEEDKILETLLFLINHGASLTNIAITLDNYKIIAKALTSKKYIKERIDLSNLLIGRLRGSEHQSLLENFYLQILQGIVSNHDITDFKGLEFSRDLKNPNHRNVVNDSKINLLKDQIKLICQRNKDFAKIKDVNPLENDEQIKLYIKNKFNQIAKEISESIVDRRKYFKIDDNYLLKIAYSFGLDDSYNNLSSTENFANINSYIADHIDKSVISKIKFITNDTHSFDENLLKLKNVQIIIDRIDAAYKKYSEVVSVLSDFKFFTDIKEISDVFRDNLKLKLDEKTHLRFKNQFSSLKTVDDLEKFFEVLSNCADIYKESFDSNFTNNLYASIEDLLSRVNDSKSLKKFNQTKEILIKNFPNYQTDIKDKFDEMQSDLISDKLELDFSANFFYQKVVEDDINIEEIIKSKVNNFVDQGESMGYSLALSLTDKIKLTFRCFGEFIANKIDHDIEKKDEKIKHLGSYIYFFAKHKNSLANYFYDSEQFLKDYRNFDQISQSSQFFNEHEYQIDLANRFEKKVFGEIRESLANSTKFKNLNHDLYNELSTLSKNKQGIFQVIFANSSNLRIFVKRRNQEINRDRLSSQSFHYYDRDEHGSKEPSPAPSTPHSIRSYESRPQSPEGSRYSSVTLSEAGAEGVDVLRSMPASSSNFRGVNNQHMGR